MEMWLKLLIHFSKLNVFRNSFNSLRIRINCKVTRVNYISMILMTALDVRSREFTIAFIYAL